MVSITQPPAPQGWMCPNCGSAHAPTVQTCPNVFGTRTVFAPSFYLDCNCAGALEGCDKTSCPRRMYRQPYTVTSTTSPQEADRGPNG